MPTLSGLILTRDSRPGRHGLDHELWLASDQGPALVRITGQPALMFVEHGASTRAGHRRPTDRTSLEGRPVDELAFDSQRDLLDEARRLRASGARVFESDVRPLDRFLMERFVTGSLAATGAVRQRPGHLELVDPELAPSDAAPPLRVLSFDIETDGTEGSLLSIAAVDGEAERVLLLGAGLDDELVRCLPDERALIEAFLAWVAERDPDVLIGWNVVEFDLAVLERRAAALGLALSLGRATRPARVLQRRDAAGPAIARVPGRVVLDGIAALRTATRTFESYSLEYVARELLGRGKRIGPEQDKVAEIRRLHREDPRTLAAYNLEDCRLVAEIFEQTRLVDFAVQRQRLTGLAMDRPGGSVAAFDHLYLPRLHRHGHVAPDVGDSGESVASPGGHVLESAPGLHANVLVLDFKSLYPSLIRTFRIDPMGLAFPGEDPVLGLRGARFSRERSILPGLIESLWAERDGAKRAGDAALSQAIKILMNSFYGVLGTPGCRFFDPRLASSITLRGHEVLERSRGFVEERGHRVIYGDTDSLFVLLGEGPEGERCRAIGGELARDLNARWLEVIAAEHRLESFLELQFETHYARFLMPTTRGTARGSKKRYAGLARAADGRTRLVVRGLEAVRTDWTPLARRFQRELLRRVFCDEPFEAWVREVADDLRAGRLDAELVYRKRLRRRAEDYASGLPPHVRAARLVGQTRGTVEYLMTVDGPEPLATRRSPVDHEHYLSRQLAPAADIVLRHLGTDFAGLAGLQMRLF